MNTHNESTLVPSPRALRTGWRARVLAKVTASDEVGMRDHLHADKVALFEGLRGTVVEIGPGTGPNLPYFGPDPHVIGIEPNAFVREELERKIAAFPGTFELRTGTAEFIDLPDDSADAVVSTMVLCSVSNVDAALSEVRRVLKPGGRFLFIEHILSPESAGLRALQYVATPFWHTCGDGCCPVRKTHLHLEKAGFASLDYRFVRYPFPIPVAASCIVGTAVA